MSGIWLKGLDDIIVTFQAESVLAAPRAHAVISKTAKKVSETMKTFAPVGERNEDGVHMRDTIGYDTKLMPEGAEGEIGPTATRDGFPYPAAVEWGTSKMAPQAFAGPALDRHSSDFVTDIANEVVGL